MVVAVLEIPEDDGPNVYFVDMDRLDLKNSIHKHYSKNINAAIKDSMGIATTSYDASLSYGPPSLQPTAVNPPCTVDHSVILYIE